LVVLFNKENLSGKVYLGGLLVEMNQQKITLNHLAALLVLLTVFFPAQAHALIALSEQNLLNRDSGSINSDNATFNLPDAPPQLTPKKRGAPKGNRNALGNRGNRTNGDLRSKAREGKPRGGAPAGNTNAQKVRQSFFDELAVQYKGNSEVEQWLASVRQDESAMRLLSEPGEPGWRGEQLEDFMIDIGAQQRWMASQRHF
jgi:hypothetical protein